MFVDTNAIHALSRECSTQADDLCTAAAALRSLPGPDAAIALGPVASGFLTALTDAITEEARRVAVLSDDLASAHTVTGDVAHAYADADRRGSRLL